MKKIGPNLDADLIKRLTKSPISDLSKHSTRTLILTAKALKVRFDKSNIQAEQEAIVTTIAYINNIVNERKRRYGQRHTGTT